MEPIMMMVVDYCEQDWAEVEGALAKKKKKQDKNQKHNIMLLHTLEQEDNYMFEIWVWLWRVIFQLIDLHLQDRKSFF